MTDYQKLISEECSFIEKFLLDKNRKYGSSVFEPSGIFSKLSQIEGIKCRIDDKLKRIKNSPSDEDEDVDIDLIGYLIILRIAKKLSKESNVD